MATYNCSNCLSIKVMALILPVNTAGRNEKLMKPDKLKDSPD